MGALFAAMQRDVTFWTVAVPVDPVRQLRGTTETASRCNRLNQARQARTGYVERCFRTRRPGPLIAAAVSEIRAIRVHITRLSVLSVAVHGEVGTPKSRRGNKVSNPGAPGLSRIPIDHHISGPVVQATVVDVGLPEGICGEAERSAQTGRENQPMLQIYM